jgi:hypothetical protein
MLKLSKLKSNSPTSPYLPNFQDDAKQSGMSVLMEYVLCSRKTANRIMFLFALFQLILFGSSSIYCYAWHLERLKNSPRDTFGMFLIYVSPSLLALPISISFMIWPFYVALGIRMSRTFHDVHTIAPHLIRIREIQKEIYSSIHKIDFDKEIDQMHKSIGSRLPLEIKLMIEKRLEDAYNERIASKIAALTWKSKIQYRHQPNWTRVTLLWSMYTGINERYQIPSYWTFSMRNYWVLVFSRDAFLVSLSCLFRYSMIIWILFALQPST